MTKDRELLELAAKAAGLPWAQWVEDGDASWNPLTDDGDALRLAVKLRLEVDIHHTGIAVRTPNGHKVLLAAEDQPNAYTATRRAIVRAAAEIGRLMP
jgi:hypothetical protein